MRKKMLLALIGVVSMFTLASCGSTQTENEVKSEREQLIVGMEAGYAPFNWTQTDDSNGGFPIKDSKEYAGGYDVEIAKQLAESLDLELVIERIEWDGLVPALTSGRIDAIIAGMSPTESRKETIDFSDNYYESDLVMLVSSNGDYTDAKTLADFENAKITAQLNTFHYSVIDQIPNVSMQEAMSDFPAMRVALQSGIIDGYVTERPEAISAETANDNFKMIIFEDGFVTSQEDTAIAVGLQKGSDLMDDINNALSQISSESRIKIMDDAILNQPAVN